MATTRDDVVVVERPRRGRGLRILIGLILLAVVAAVVAIVILATKESDDAKDDVSIQSCEADSGGGQPTASGQVNNTTSKDSNYTIRGEFAGPDGNTLTQGQTAVRRRRVGLHCELGKPDRGPSPTDGQVRCEVSGASRTHVPGQ